MTSHPVSMLRAWNNDPNRASPMQLRLAHHLPSHHNAEEGGGRHCWSEASSMISQLHKAVVLIPLTILLFISSPRVWAEGGNAVETEDAAQTSPVPRGPAHDLVPLQYDPRLLKSGPKDFLEECPPCIPT